MTASPRTIAYLERNLQRLKEDISRGVIPPTNQDEIIEYCYFGVWTTLHHDDGIRRPMRIQGCDHSPPFTRYNPDTNGDEWLNRQRVRQLTAIFSAELLKKVKKSK